MKDAKKEKTTHTANEEKNKAEPGVPRSTRLYRSETNKVLAGIAGGLGDYFNIDPTIVRILFILLTIFGGSGLIIYIVLWLIIPAKSEVSKNSQDAIRANIEEIKERTQTFAHSISHPGDKENSKFWWALIIIVIGFLFLLNNYGLLEPLELDKLWPLILIIFGLAIILRKS